MVMSLFQKKVAERKTQQQLETELGALKDALVGLKDAETALAKTDFVYESEITAIGRMRNVLAERVTSLQAFIDQQQTQPQQQKHFW